MKKGKIWSLVFLALAFLTVWAVISQSKSFSLAQLGETLRSSSKGWMFAAVISMLGFILFEGMAILCIVKELGYRRSLARGFLYSAADIYFSAITPSATGGQPASAYFMMQDQIPGAVTTISLVANLIMHTLALLTVGTVSFVLRPGVLTHFNFFSKIFIGIGYVMLCILAIAFCTLIAKPLVLERVCVFFLKLGKKLHLVKHEEEKREKLKHVMLDYRQCAYVMAQHKFMFVKVFLFNLLQRVSQVTVTILVYLATGGKMEHAVDIWCTQSFVAIGTYSVPIPGGMGVADYLLIDGLKALMDETAAVNLELISRGMAFYISMIVSAMTVLIGIIYTMKRRKTK
ncbi:MAG: flippase-like domain-containing protein [Acetatifactor sp.]|nr:flippase-like domain-containing protein [Acetatifactor sp.]